MSIAPDQRQDMRALVIDDSGVERMLAAAMLTSLGYVVDAAPDADAALRLVACQCYRLALCDVSLPGMDGLALLAALRGLDASLPVIMLSSHDDVAFRLAAMRRGALAYLLKPLRLAALSALLETGNARRLR
jgi:DNA-binding response OmpR family regulator